MTKTTSQFLIEQTNLIVQACARLNEHYVRGDWIDTSQELDLIDAALLKIEANYSGRVIRQT